MAKSIRKERGRRIQKDDHLPLERMNFIILGVGIVLIVLGYIAMAEGSVEGFLPLTVAPVLLLLGYCVVIPLGIMYREGIFARKQSTEVPTEQSS